MHQGYVKSVNIVLERNTWLCVNIWVDYTKGGSQCFVSPVLNDNSNGHATGSDYILRLFELFDVQSFRDIEGKKVEALFDQNDHWNSSIKGLKVENRAFWITDWIYSLKQRGML